MQRNPWGGLLAVTAAAVLGGFVSQAPTAAPARAQSPTPDRIDTGKACYVRLPSLPDARYGGFGGYNPDTGVLVYAGGAQKFGANETRTFSDMWAIKLDGTKSNWTNVPYNASVGYESSKSDRGCREMATVALNGTNWLSVFGKDGCDGANTAAVDSGKKATNGDLKELTIGDSASSTGVRWVTNSGVSSLPAGTDLQTNKGKIVRMFAAWDGQRNRVVFGQGTVNDEIEGESQDEVYAATKSGAKWNVQQLNVGGAKPQRRFGACAAAVYNQDTGADGILVLGGNSGGQSGTTTFNDVHWIDFSANRTGVWQDITGRFSNQKTADADGLSFGGRREGGCAYDAERKMFYSWFGRASSSIKDGASHATGLWRVDLSNLHDPGAALKWERLAADNLETTTSKQIRAVRLFPSVWDWKHKRFFVMGGRASGSDGNEALADVWALYPDVTGEACANLDVYAPFRPGAPTVAPPATATPGSGPTSVPAPTRTTGPLPTADASVAPCPNVDAKVPAAALAQALSNPSSLSGFGMACNPNVPQSPVNPLRRHVTLRNVNLPYHPLYNGLVLRCGCQ